MGSCMERIRHSKPNVDDNGISCGTIDDDGFVLKENISGTGIYIYFSEIDDVIQQMRKLKYEHSGNSVHAKEVQDVNQLGFKKFSELSNYYKSDEWKKKRMMRLQHDGFRCVNCGSQVGLEVHHICYDHLGMEDVKGDLRTLCSRCHDKKTRLNGKKFRGVVTDFS